MDRATLVSVIASGTIGVALGTGVLYWMMQEKPRGGPPQGAETVSVDPVELCDELAAHAHDPEAVMPPVDDEALDADVAITACEEAVRQEPGTPRLRFQLARGYLLAGHAEEGVRELTTAAEHGHGGALAYLGEIHLDGVSGVEADPALAKSLFERAAEAGFEPARTLLAEFEEVIEPAVEEPAAPLAAALVEPAPAARSKPNYNNPEIVENIRRGNLDAVPYGEIYTKSYLVNMAQNIAVACEGAHFNRRDLDQLVRQAAFTSVELTPEAGWNQIFGGLMEMGQVIQNPQATLERSVIAEQEANAMPAEAMQDAFALASVDDCGSPAMDKFAGHLRAYVSNEGAPRLSTNEMSAKCMREARPTGRYDAQNFCMCFTGKMTRAPISRAQRKALGTDFWGTAQELMASDPAHYNTCINGWN